MQLFIPNLNASCLFCPKVSGLCTISLTVKQVTNYFSLFCVISSVTTQVVVRNQSNTKKWVVKQNSR